MSTLWTPSGEHPVPRQPTGQEHRGSTPPGPGGRAPAGAGARGGGARPDRDRPDRDRPDSGHQDEAFADGAYPDPGEDGTYTEEELRQAEREMDTVRQQLLRAPVEVVIANHAMGLWELAALHLSQDPPDLRQSKMAIDAMGAVLEALAGQLGDAEKTLGDGLSQIRMAFVQIANSERAKGPGAG